MLLLLILFTVGIAVFIVKWNIKILWNYSLYKGKYSERRECTILYIICFSITSIVSTPLSVALQISFMRNLLLNAIMIGLVYIITIHAHRKAQKKEAIRKAREKELAVQGQ